MAWRVARSLETLRGQFNAAFPDRSKLSDGTIGDAAHSSSRSFHNPDSNGIVRALDITHDPGDGVSIGVVVAQLVASRDPRIHELIANGRYWSKARPTWRTYTGANRHTWHFHIACVSPATGGDSTVRWNLPIFAGRPIVIAPRPSPPSAVLRRGATGAKVTQLQRVLAAWYPSMRVVVDGIFGSGTEYAVRQFQARTPGLVVDGVAGQLTLRKLGL